MYIVNGSLFLNVSVFQIKYNKNISCSKANFHLPVGKQRATCHTWQTEEVPNMIIKIQVQVPKQMQPNVIILYTLHTNLNYFNRYFFPEFNIRLYDKNSESDFFFFAPPKSEYFFPFKLNGRSLNQYKNMFMLPLKYHINLFYLHKHINYKIVLSK